jgi:hypothetical protein
MPRMPQLGCAHPHVLAEGFTAQASVSSPPASRFLCSVKKWNQIQALTLQDFSPNVRINLNLRDTSIQLHYRS